MTDLVMYLRYCKKVITLEWLRLSRGLNYTGRVESLTEHFRGYEGCYPVKGIIDGLNITNTDSVIDIGCGKGLFIYYATKYDFNRIDGIEFSSQLVDYARKNAEIIGDSRIHIYHSDARTFKHYDNYNIFFINNPFDATIMEQVAHIIEDSYKKRKRKIWVVYQFPYNVDVFKKYGFELLHEKFPNAVLTFG